MTDNSMIYAGIDVAKNRLDLALYPGELTFSVSNDRQGFAALDRLLAERDVARIGFEASGGYELKLMMHLRKGCRAGAAGAGAGLCTKPAAARQERSS